MTSRTNDAYVLVSSIFEWTTIQAPNCITVNVLEMVDAIQLTGAPAAPTRDAYLL